MTKILDKIFITLLFILVGFFTWQYGYPYFEMRQQEVALKNKIKNEKQMLSLYTKIDTGIETPLNFNDIEGNGQYMFITQNNKLYSVECPSKITLSDKNVVKYFTQAPKGMLMYYKYNWYIANVSKLFVDKQHTIEHIRECVLKIEMEIKENISQKNMNTRSWSN